MKWLPIVFVRLIQSQRIVTVTSKYSTATCSLIQHNTSLFMHGHCRYCPVDDVIDSLKTSAWNSRLQLQVNSLICDSIIGLKCAWAGAIVSSAFDLSFLLRKKRIQRTNPITGVPCVPGLSRRGPWLHYLST
jgi:hypothetical protein